MLYAVIDVGSNSVRLSVYQCENGNIQPLIDKKDTVGLAGYIENGIMVEEGMKKAAETIGNFYTIARNFNIPSISVFATASLRNVANQEEVLRYIREYAGVAPEIITGEEEARLDFIGSTHFLKMERGILVDIGGGSTELVLFDKGSILHLSSFPIGSLNLYQNHVSGVFPDKEERLAIKKHIRQEFEKLCWRPENDVALICGVGGTVRAFRKLCRELLGVPAEVEYLDTEYLSQLNRMLRKGDLSMRRRFYKAVPERMLNIQPGLMLLAEVAKMFGSKQVVVSKYGVREGYLIDKVLGKQKLS